MTKILFLLATFAGAAHANTCVLNAAGNWTAAGTWTSCGGVAPTAADDVQVSGSAALTIDAGAVCRSADFTGYAGTLTQGSSGTLTIGDGTAGLTNIALKMPPGFTYAPNSASAITFVSTSATQQTVYIDSGYTAGNVTFNSSSNGNYAIVTTGITTATASTVTLTKGTLHADGAGDNSGLTHSWGLFNSNNSNTRNLQLGTANITTKQSSNFSWFVGTSGLTFSAGTSTLTSSGVSDTWVGGNLTYNNLTCSGMNCNINASSGSSVFSGTLSLSACGTMVVSFSSCATCTFTGSASKTDSLQINANFTATAAVSFVGNSATNRLLVFSSVLGTARTITNSGATMTGSQNADFRDISVGTAWNAAAITGNSGDCGGNSGITFTTSATQTATGTASFSWSTHGWTSRVPLPQDDVVINNAFIAGRTVTLDMPRAGRDINWTGATGTPAWAKTTATTIYGSITMIAGMTNSGTSNVTIESIARSGTKTFTSAGQTWTNPLIVQPVSATFQFSDPLTSSSSITHNNGTLDSNGQAVTSTTFTSNSGLTRTLTLGTTTWTVNSTGAVWTTANAGLTLSAASSTIVISNTTQATSKTFATGTSQTYGDITFSGKNIIVTCTTGITFATMALNNLGDTAGLSLQASRTYTVTGFTTTASSGNVAKLISGTSGAAATLSKTSGTVSVDWVSIKDSTATGGASWYAGANSTNVSGNTGWTFTAPPSSGVRHRLIGEI